MISSAYPLLAIVGGVLGFFAGGLPGAAIGITCGFALSILLVARLPR